MSQRPKEVSGARRKSGHALLAIGLCRQERDAATTQKDTSETKTRAYSRSEIGKHLLRHYMMLL